MQIPIVSNIQELDRAPRKFLLFTVFNVISWQCIVGQVLILLARKVEMPPSRVGFLISFMPLSIVLVAGTIPLVMRLGPKRLMFGTWMLRNIFACSVFLMPWAIDRWGSQTAWHVLMCATLGFCLIRAMGVGGWFPWLHEVIPEHQRAAYFSAETSVAQLVNVAVMFGQALMLRGDPGLGRFLFIYGVGISSGFFSLVWMSRVPGGGAAQETVSMHGSFRSYAAALADRPFVCFVLTAVLSFSSVAWMTASIVMFMRDALMLFSSEIMTFMALGSTGILLTVRFWARFADHSGSGRAMFKTLTGHAVAALACIFLIPGTPWAIYALIPLVLFTLIFQGAFWLAAHRAMLYYVKESNRVGYTNLWMLGSALSLGVTPILAGAAIDAWGIWGFRLCFAISGVAGLCCAVVCRLVVQDGEPFEPSVSQMLNPLLPIRMLARIAWITLGLHESNR